MSDSGSAVVASPTSVMNVLMTDIGVGVDDRSPEVTTVTPHLYGPPLCCEPEERGKFWV